MRSLRPKLLNLQVKPDFLVFSKAFDLLCLNLKKNALFKFTSDVCKSFFFTVVLKIIAIIIVNILFIGLTGTPKPTDNNPNIYNKRPQKKTDVKLSLTLNGGLKDNFLPKAAFDNSDYLMKQNFLNRVTFKRVIDFIRGHNHVTFDELLPKVRSILAQFGAPEKVINICLDCLKQIHQKISPSIEPNLDNPKLFLLNISIILQYINLDGNTPVFANYCDSRGLHSRTGVLLYHYAFYFPNLICNLISEGQKSGAFDIVKISPNDLKKKSIEYSLKWLKLQFATFPITLIAFMLNFILAPLEVIFLVTNLFDSFVLRLKLVINSLTGIIWNIILTIFWTIIRPIFWNIILPIFWGPSWGLSNPFIRLALTIDFIILALIIVLIIVLPYRWANKALENWLKLHYKIYTSLQFSTELLFKAIDWGLTFVKTVKESLFLSIELLFKAIDWASTFVKTVKEYPLNLSYVNFYGTLIWYLLKGCIFTTLNKGGFFFKYLGKKNSFFNHVLVSSKTINFLSPTDESSPSCVNLKDYNCQALWKQNKHYLYYFFLYYTFGWFLNQADVFNCIFTGIDIVFNVYILIWLRDLENSLMRKPVPILPKSVAPSASNNHSSLNKTTLFDIKNIIEDSKAPKTSTLPGKKTLYPIFYKAFSKLASYSIFYKAFSKLASYSIFYKAFSKLAPTNFESSKVFNDQVNIYNQIKLMCPMKVDSISNPFMNVSLKLVRLVNLTNFIENLMEYIVQNKLYKTLKANKIILDHKPVSSYNQPHYFLDPNGILFYYNIIRLIRTIKVFTEGQIWYLLIKEGGPVLIIVILSMAKSILSKVGQILGLLDPSNFLKSYPYYVYVLFLNFSSFFLPWISFILFNLITILFFAWTFYWGLAFLAQFRVIRGSKKQQNLPDFQNFCYQYTRPFIPALIALGTIKVEERDKSPIGYPVWISESFLTPVEKVFTYVFRGKSNRAKWQYLKERKKSTAKFGIYKDHLVPEDHDFTDYKTLILGVEKLLEPFFYLLMLWYNLNDLCERYYDHGKIYTGLNRWLVKGVSKRKALFIFYLEWRINLILPKIPAYLLANYFGLSNCFYAFFNLSYVSFFAETYILLNCFYTQDIKKVKIKCSALIALMFVLNLICLPILRMAYSLINAGKVINFYYNKGGKLFKLGFLTLHQDSWNLRNLSFFLIDRFIKASRVAAMAEGIKELFRRPFF